MRVIEGAYILENLGGETRFTLTRTYEGNVLWKFLVPIMRLQVSRTAYPQMLGQLKENVEGEVSSRSTR